MTTRLFLGLIPFLLISCTVDQADQPENSTERQQLTGRISIPLTITSSSGETYRLQLPSIDLQGPNESINLNLEGSEDFDISLQEGSWIMGISDQWILEKLNSITGDFEEVEAEMTSENPQNFSIVGGETTSVLIRFETNGETVEFQNGDLEIDIVVDDSNSAPEADPVDADGDGFTSDVDCDDNDNSINPARFEECNGVDDNCDGEIDNGVIDGTNFFGDADGDGYGDPTVFWEMACEAPEGYVEDASDCNDSDATINPSAEEIINDGVDQDCDGADDLGSEPMENDSDLMALSGPLSDGYGFVADSLGHAIPNDLSQSFYIVESDTCQMGPSGAAFYRLASIDHNENFFIDTGIAGVHGEEIVTSFSNLEDALAIEELSIEELSISFGWIDLGDDVRGVDWDVSGDTEWRVYANNENSVVTISFAGEPMLVAPMTSVYMELDNNNPDNCWDDSITGISDRIFDFEISPEASPLSAILGQAMLEDISDEGLWMYMGDDSAPIMRTMPIYSGNNFLIGTGEQPL